MFKTNLSFYLIALFFSTILSAQYTETINSNRPGESQGAYSVGKSIFQVETGVNGISETHELLGTELLGVYASTNFRWGLLKEVLEFNLELKYQTDSYTTALGIANRNALKQTIIGAKYLIYDPFKNRIDKPNLLSWKANQKFDWRQFIPAVSVYAAANLNFDNVYSFKNEPDFSPKIVLIAQNHFKSGFVLVTNIIADKFTTEYPSFGYIITLTKGLNSKTAIFFENQGYMSDLYADSIIRGGLTYMLKKNLQIDGSFSGNFKKTPSILYGGIGFSWRYEKNYKPVIIKSKKTKKETESKKSK